MAEAVQDPSVRAELLVIVSQYDERAERLEAQEREAEKPTRRDLTASRLRAPGARKLWRARVRRGTHGWRDFGVSEAAGSGLGTIACSLASS
jgi:hypothetical protein